jgi:exopolysaccharide biosynthesis predicted pyruvyltransferase EpsI
VKELDLNEYLSTYRHDRVDFYRFPGNYGDSLIWHGTMKLLEGLDIAVNYVDENSGNPNKTLLIDGGGNLVDYYHDVRNCLERTKDRYQNIIILPHTIYGEKQKELLRSLNNNIAIFCRERMSYEFVSKHARNCEVYLWHDTAFYNKLDQIKSGAGVLNAFRNDVESIKKNIPADNNDLSRNGYAKKPLDQFLQTISLYTVINTDRLHVAIAATLMGKRVNLFANSYYKNAAVFDYSLKKYPNIKFIKNEKDFEKD